jgi:hypothetical protein
MDISEPVSRDELCFFYKIRISVSKTVAEKSDRCFSSPEGLERKRREKENC